ncbi:MAG: hypothetical protein B6I20_10115 [Bacteroidetes bacterium 4572_117]|nr:MAG: hypothetical protein B6I20_10115 [Bacteroidetes bacterium 4572_117]
MKNIIWGLLALVFLQSCIANKIKYIQDKNEVFEHIGKYPNKPKEYKLQKKDILYVKISSTNKEINEYFKMGSSSSTQNSNNSQNSNFYLNGFTINDSGFVQIPILGLIKVSGLNIAETTEIMQKKTNEYLNNAIVDVKLVSFLLTFLGEVNSQGKITVFDDKVNILDAIALAGGISDFGNKQNVLVIRKTTDGSKTFRVDLTDRSLLTSEKYYLLPNDMIIVEPLPNKTLKMSIADYSMILTTITSTITMVLLILNLSK